MKSSHLEQKQSENWLEILAKNSSYKDKKFEHMRNFRTRKEKRKWNYKKKEEKYVAELQRKKGVGVGEDRFILFDSNVKYWSRQMN